MATDYDTQFDAQTARKFYAARGWEPIPLKPKTKNPQWLGRGWNTRPLDELWNMAHVSQKSRTLNIGLRFTPAGYDASHHVAVDVDENKRPGTWANVSAAFAGLGVDAPVVQTASGVGRRVFVSCPDVPEAVTKTNLNPDVGAGELYARFGQVVAPWSFVDDGKVTGTYRLISGSWDAVPAVAWADLRQLVTTTTDRLPQPDAPITATAWRAGRLAIVTNLPVRLLFRDPADLDVMFRQLNAAGKGQSIEWGERVYRSRSEFDAFIVAQLVLNGWGYDAVRAEYQRRAGGKFGEYKRPADADKYLRRTWEFVVSSLCASETRRAIAAEYQRAAADAELARGRMGGNRKSVYLAVLADAWTANSTRPTVSVREVAEHAAIGRAAAGRNLASLRRDGFIRSVSGWDIEHARRWELPKLGESQNGTSDIASPPYVTCPILRLADVGHPELWRSTRGGGLGKSAGLVYAALDELHPRDVGELATMTGKSRATVHRALSILNDERLRMAAAVPGGWIRGPADLDEVAVRLKCSRRAKRRRDEHANERARMKRAIRERQAREAERDAARTSG